MHREMVEGWRAFRGIECNERARVDQQKLKRRAEIEQWHRWTRNLSSARPCIAIWSASPDAEMEASSLVNRNPYKSVRYFLWQRGSRPHCCERPYRILRLSYFSSRIYRCEKIFFFLIPCIYMDISKPLDFLWHKISYRYEIDLF